MLLSARTSLTNEADAFTAAAADVLQEGLNAGVRVVACKLAMDKTGTNESDLLDGIDTAPNGFHELFRLQNNGYETLQL